MKYNPNTPKDFLKGHVDSASKIGYDSTNKSANRDNGESSAQKDRIPSNYVEKKILKNGAEYTGFML